MSATPEVYDVEYKTLVTVRHIHLLLTNRNVYRWEDLHNQSVPGQKRNSHPFVPERPVLGVHLIIFILEVDFIPRV